MGIYSVSLGGNAGCMPSTVVDDFPDDIRLTSGCMVETRFRSPGSR